MENTTITILIILAIGFVIYKVADVIKENKEYKKELERKWAESEKERDRILRENAKRMEENRRNRQYRSFEDIFGKYETVDESNPMFKVPKKKRELLLKLHMMATRGTENEKIVATKKIGNIVNSFKISKKDYNTWAKIELKKSFKR